MEIPCSNDGCCEHIARCDMLAHCNVCEFELVPCKYAEIGCEVEVLRKDLEKHKSDREQHLDLAINTLPDLQQISIDQQTTLDLLQSKISRINVSVDSQNITLQEMVKQQKNTLARLQSIVLAQNKEISELKSKLEKQACAPPYDPWNDCVPHVQPQMIDPVSDHDLNVFKFTDYAKRKSCNSSVFSPPIYSSPGGYKMCIEVIPNGGGRGKGTHVSVYAYLMHGENDDHLPWPFAGTVVIELLNQLTDQNHLSVSIKMTKDKGTSQRVLDDDRAKTGRGRTLYIAHSSLDYNDAENCQYLKDDCLYFRLQINSVVSSKPWLSSADVF